MYFCCIFPFLFIFSDLIFQTVCLGRRTSDQIDIKPKPYLSSKKGRAKIIALAAKHKDSLKESFKSVDFFSATTDVWSRSNKSFIAVSVHYYDGFQLKTAFIACEAFPGKHTNDKVAVKLNQIFTRYNILDKVYFVTTDGATEYCAAFKYYADNYNSMSLLSNQQFDWEFYEASDEMLPLNETDPGNNSNQPENVSNVENDNDSDDEVDFIGYNRIERDSSASANVSADANDNGNVFVTHDLFDSDTYENENLLPKMNRIACSSHLLDKVGKKDVLLAKRDGTYAAIHDRAFKKLELIWELKNSRLSAEVFSKHTGKKLIGPHRIRWMKTYDAVIFKL